MDKAVGRRVAVIGGGPAGLMAATVVAAAGVAVDLYEAKPTVGRKFLLAGRSGLNLTNAEPLAAFLDRYGPAKARMAPVVEAFPPEALRAWLADLGVETFVGSSGRVFPAGMKAAALLREWLRRLAGLGVVVHTRYRWVGFSDGRLRFQRDGNETIGVAADATVVALGGASWPRMGSDGAWVGLLAAEGVAVAPLKPANCGFEADWSEAFADRWEGAPLKNIAATFAGHTVRGEITVTRHGLEGGPVYALGAALRDAIETTGEAALVIDLKPDLDLAQVEARLSRPRRRASLSNFLRKTLGLTGVAVALLRERRYTPDDGAAFAACVKGLAVPLLRPRPISEAISTAGGVRFSELDDQLMLIRRPGVFVAGEMLDWEAPTGGFLLQGAFSTGWWAGRGALNWLGVTAR